MLSHEELVKNAIECANSEAERSLVRQAGQLVENIREAQERITGLQEMIEGYRKQLREISVAELTKAGILGG